MLRSGRTATATSIIEDSWSISWLWLFSAPVVSPLLMPSRMMEVFSWAIWLSRLLT